jgi:imidazolonepropionase-like amidohydrolase
MNALRTIGKWFLGLCILVILIAVVMRIGVHMKRAHYSKLAEQPPSAFIVESAPVIVLAHARVIDGTASPVQDDQTLILDHGKIAEVGPASTVSVPPGARVIDLSGKTVIPGLVMLHEHLFTISPDSTPKQILLVEQPVSFPLMYLAGGVTTLRTTGSIDAQADLAIKRAIDSGLRPGPDMFLTAPYLESEPLIFSQMHALANPEEVRRAVDEGVAEGMTSFKAYVHLTPDELRAAIDEVHSKGLKITGHLCSIGFTEAADMGIDGLEHGIGVDTEFFPGKQPGVCPADRAAEKDFDERVDVESPEVQRLIHRLVERHVAITSTMVVFQDATDEIPPMSSLEDREMRALSFKSALIYRMLRKFVLPKIVMHHLMGKEMQFERDFVAAGGLLLAGSDPTGDGSTLAGYADQREIELLVKAGFTPVEAIHIATANGAEYLGQSARIGTIAKGKQADLVIIAGDPSRNVSDIRNVDIVFRNGVGYSSAKLFDAVNGLVGVK